MQIQFLNYDDYVHMFIDGKFEHGDHSISGADVVKILSKKTLKPGEQITYHALYVSVQGEENWHPFLNDGTHTFNEVREFLEQNAEHDSYGNYVLTTTEADFE